MTNICTKISLQFIQQNNVTCIYHKSLHECIHSHINTIQYLTNLWWYFFIKHQQIRLCGKQILWCLTFTVRSRSPYLSIESCLLWSSICRYDNNRCTWLSIVNANPQDNKSSRHPRLETDTNHQFMYFWMKHSLYFM